MLNYQNAVIEKIIIYSIGDKSEGENIHSSEFEIEISDSQLKELLVKFFFSSFKTPEYYSFTYPEDDFTSNPLFNFASHIFDNDKTFQQNSTKIAKHYNDISDQTGYLFVAYFNDLIIDDEAASAVGIYKSETKLPFLKLEEKHDKFSLLVDYGINAEKPDKACLILNTERSIGFRICIADNTKYSKAPYWKDKFLQLKPFNDDFYFTRQVMNITKDYVMKELPGDIATVDKIDLLNRSARYFKTKENFNKKEFEEDVLQDEGLISSYRGYNKRYMQEHDLDLSDTFEISPQAVKSQSRIFKSVLKLDKNFHIYIHGDSDLITKGSEKDGRKFYKIYYNNEA